MGSDFEISQPVIPRPLNKSLGAAEICNFQGDWRLVTNAGSPNFKAHVEDLVHKNLLEFSFEWDTSSTTEASDLNFRQDLGYFQPRQPLFLLFQPESLTIKPELIIQKIRWKNAWDIFNFQSTDEYHCVIGRFIQISSRSERGLYYGLKTLDQLIQTTGNQVPFQTIHDAPQESLRAVDINWMIPDLVPEFIQRILEIAGEYKINAILIHAEEHIPTQQFEIEFSKHYISFGKFLQRIKQFNPDSGSKSISWVGPSVTMGFYPLLHYEIIYKAACLWEGRNIGEPAFVPRYWRNFFFKSVHSADRSIIEDPKLPLFFSNLLCSFADMPVKQHKLPFLEFFAGDYDRLTAKLAAQQQTLDHFQTIIQNCQIRCDKNASFLQFFGFLIHYCQHIQKLIQIRRQTKQEWHRMTHLQTIDEISNSELSTFGQSVDDLTHILTPFIEEIPQECGWFLLAQSPIIKDCFGLRTSHDKILQLSQSLNGYLKYSQDLLNILQSWK